MSAHAYGTVRELVDCVTRWHVPPRCQGQTVEVAYGTDDLGRGYRRRTDRSDGAVTYDMCSLNVCGCDTECDCWDPANREPTSPPYLWQRLT